jgi:hypothetical protein
MRQLRPWSPLLIATLLLAWHSPALADIRIGDLDVFLNDHEVSVNVTVLGAVPPAFLESVESGIPAHIRFTIELWQYSRFWRDRLLNTRIVERHLTYNVVAKEYKVTALKGEARPIYATREMRDAVRVLSEVRGAKLSPASALGGSDVVYVRVRAETALNGENTFVSRMAGTAEETMRQSDYLTIVRIQ